MEKTDLNGYCRTTLPVFLAGLGTGIVLTLLLSPLSGAALRSGIGRKVKDGADWMEGKATAVKDEVKTQAAGLRDGVKAVAETITRG